MCVCVCVCVCSDSIATAEDSSSERTMFGEGGIKIATLEPGG